MRKKLLTIGIIVVAVVVLAIVVVALNLNGIVKKGIVTVGPMVLGVPVELDKASVSPLRGRVVLEGFALGSPEGFEAPEMFRVGRVSVRANIMSFLSDELVVHEVEIDAAEITLEVEGVRTNWSALIAQLEKKEAPASEEAAEAPAEKAQKKVRVGVIRFTNGKVKISGLPLAGSKGVPLPSLEITEFGTGDATAVTIATMVKAIVRSLYKAILQAADKVIPADQLKQLGAGLGSVVKDLGGTGAEKAKGLFKGIKDILPSGEK